MLLTMIAFVSLLGVAATALYVYLYGSHRLVEQRLNELAIKQRMAHTFDDDGEAIPDTLGHALVEWLARKLPAPKSDTPAGEKLSQIVAQAGLLRSDVARTFQAIRLITTLAAGVLGLVLGYMAGGFSRAFLMFFCGAAVGFLAPSYYLIRRARGRQRQIARQLSDALDLLVVCVEAGLGLFEAIKIVGRETERQQQEIGQELSLVGAEISAGASLGQALRSLAERSAVEDVKPLAATLIQSEQLGAQMAPALRASSEQLLARRKLRAEEAAQKATIKILFPLVLFVLPAMIMVIVGPAIIQVMHTLTGG